MTIPARRALDKSPNLAAVHRSGLIEPGQWYASPMRQRYACVLAVKGDEVEFAWRTDHGLYSIEKVKRYDFATRFFVSLPSSESVPAALVEFVAGVTHARQ